MKKLSFKSKTTILITLLTAAVCSLSFAGMLAMSRRVANTEIRQALIRTVERNADEIEYKNGILEIESDFAFYSDGIYCDVYDKNFAYIDGETPHTMLNSHEFKNGETNKISNGNKEYYIYDSRLDFSSYEYEIDVFSGQIIKYEAGVSSQGVLTEGEYSNTRFKNGISTEEAIDIALSHAGATRENSTVVSAELAAYENRQVFAVEFTCSEPLYGSIWIRGLVPADSQKSTFDAISRAIIYIIPLFIVFAALGAYLIAKKTIKPVFEISRSAKEISSSKDLTKRIEVGGRDEISNLADTFNQMLERLQTSFESEKQFTSDASHELRTPLAVIKAECDYALSENADTEDKEEALVSINEQTDKMTHLVNALLALTRAEQGTEKFCFEESNMSELVEQICESFRTDKGITLSCEAEKNIMRSIDVSLISRMLENLLSNAVRYGKENGYIKVSLYRKNKEIILSVKDNGTGIKEEDITKIWGRFYRADSSRSSCDGFGLGLALVERIAALHGAKPDVKSVFGEGSEFTVTFFEKN